MNCPIVMSRLLQLKEMLANDPKDSFLLFAIAMEYKNSDQIEEAIEQFRILQSNDPKYVGLYYHLAKCYEERDLTDKALETYDKGIIMATELNDLHAKSELMNEKMNLELEL